MEKDEPYNSVIIHVQDIGYMGSRCANTDHVPKRKKKTEDKKRKYYLVGYRYTLAYKIKITATFLKLQHSYSTKNEF